MRNKQITLQLPPLDDQLNPELNPDVWDMILELPMGIRLQTICAVVLESVYPK